MEQRNEKPQVYELIGRCAKEIGAVAKKETNKSQGWNFRGVDAVVNACAPALSRHGLFFVSRIADLAEKTHQTRNGTVMNNIRLTVEYIIYAPDGSFLATQVIGEASDSGDKGCAKAMSVAERIMLLQLFHLPTDEPDPDHLVYENTAKTGKPGAGRKPDRLIEGIRNGIHALGWGPEETRKAIAKVHDGWAIELEYLTDVEKGNLYRLLVGEYGKKQKELAGNANTNSNRGTGK